MSVVVVMGVSGSGKTTIGRLLAATLHCAFQEGDDLHSAAAIEKMRGGQPLTDADRTPWLRRIAEVIDRWRELGESGVLTCSALKRSYRDLIIGGRGDVRLVYLRGAPELLSQRLAARHGHFMPASLLDSQLADLQEPTANERPITVEIGNPPADIVAEIIDQLERRNDEGDPRRSTPIEEFDPLSGQRP